MRIYSPTFSGSVNLESTFKTDLINDLTGSLDEYYTRSGSFYSVSSSVGTEISGLDSRLDLLESKTLLSSSGQIQADISGAFTSTSSSLAGDITSLDGRLDTLEGKTLVSSSIQISYTGLSNIPSGIVSGSDQLTGSYDTRYTLSGSVSQADWNTLQNKPAGIVSSSAQITYTGISNVPSGIVSSSAQLNSSTLSGMTVSGSFSGSYRGDGSGLTGTGPNQLQITLLSQVFS